ncbi:aminopeptidase [Shewanella sp. Choline-02u-19]|uniref:M1 family metallopeptidase n=1 Tax=unclassified Shewanella TaxID=196818 RepID=UPI000C3373FC|nr:MULTISPECIES: M1 family metallopeptidase [unclassified Shewanella]PKG57083.1 aminopeptidase [Shewanella sp. GutDb-MelDb]PKH57488.1 aminopeptidase [Shewanella sp. Bg11-22]PKI28350.1 aminopeptidase [Shewanella sp. Choline-02u-19]
MLEPWDNSRDYHSFANTEQVCVKHLSLMLDVDFASKQLTGLVELKLTFLDNDTRELMLDLRDITIFNVTTGADQQLEYAIDKEDEILGQRLCVKLDPSVSSVKIHYATSPAAQGLQWLTPAQTSGKQLPFLFSQSQPINARSWIPLQDTPKARITFDAVINAPKGMRAVMSAMNDANVALDGRFSFTMEKAMPTHLLAIAVGDLAFGRLGARTGVYAEPEVVESAIAEFEDTESMVEVAESLLGPYPWGRYDMLVLPPSFPFGGMENPRLAFMTPTLIAGDKSLVSTVAHELAHSWTGNLVSNATWRDLWLNEGFTTYFTNRIVEKVFGKELAELEVVLEYGRLKEAIESTALQAQTLPANMQNQDPNEAFNRFTYDKASMFVHDLEKRLGRESFDTFLYDYVQAFAFEAITTETFVEYAKKTLLVEHADSITEADLLGWIYGEGMPEWFTAPTSNSLDKVNVALAAFTSGCLATELNTLGWLVHHWQYFLANLPLVITHTQLSDLDNVFSLTVSTNAEIACDWYKVAIRNGYTAVLPAVSDYLVKIGRGKLVRPLYAELLKAGFTAEIKNIYALARDGYHPSIAVMLDIQLEDVR